MSETKDHKAEFEKRVTGYIGESTVKHALALARFNTTSLPIDCGYDLLIINDITKSPDAYGYQNLDNNDLQLRSWFGQVKTRKLDQWGKDNNGFVDGYIQISHIANYIVRPFRLKQYRSNADSVLFLCSLLANNDKEIQSDFDEYKLCWLSSQHLKCLSIDEKESSKGKIDFFSRKPIYDKSTNTTKTETAICMGWFIKSGTEHKKDCGIPVIFDKDPTQSETTNYNYIILPSEQCDVKNIEDNNFENCNWIKPKSATKRKKR